MKLFKNKVGRPSNEIKFIRKIFIISVVALLTSAISLIISGLLLSENLDVNLYARTKKSNNITIDINPLNGDKYGGTSTKVSGGLFSDDYYTWKLAGDKYVDYTIKNNRKNDVWYGWFTYKKSENKDNLTYGKTASERGCKKIKAGGTAADEDNKKMTLASSGDSTIRIAKIKVYESEAACKNDNKATDSALNEVTIKYQYTSANSNNSSKEDSGAVAMLKALIEWIISLFEKKDTPSSGNKKTTTTAPAAKPNLKLTCPSEAQVNTKFTCTTDQVGVTISVTKINLASGYNTSFVTTSSDKTKQSMYTAPGTVYITATKAGYTTTTVAVSIKSATTTKGTTTKTTTAAKNFKTLSYSVDGIIKIGRQSTTTNCYDYAIKYGNYIAPGKSVGGDICTGSGWNRFNIIKKKIDAGVPVILEVKTGSGNPHWITVVGYNTSATEGAISTKSDILKHLYAIDPWNLNIGLADTLRGTSGYFTIPSDGSCKTWN